MLDDNAAEMKRYEDLARKALTAGNEGGLMADILKTNTAGRAIDPPRHIAIIMDGNGRWAQKRGLPRTAGHKAGAETFRRIATYCKNIGVQYLTVYAFSTENWKRSEGEVSAIMGLLKKYLLDKGYRIEEEDMVFEEGKYYPMMRVYTMHPENVVMEKVQTDSEDTAGHVSRRYPAEYLLYGGLLLQKADPVLMNYLSHRREILQGILQKMHAASKDSESSRKRRAETETELHILEETLRRYY